MDYEKCVLSLSLAKLFNYLGDMSPSARCMTEGEAVLKANHIITCGIKDHTEEQLELFALCLQTSALLEKPHEIQCFLKVANENELEVDNALCSCKAGNSSRCKHVCAVLLMCNRSNVHDFELISSTDVTCYWSKQKPQAMYAPTPVPSWPCIKKCEPLGELTDVEASSIVKAFALGLPNSALALHLKERRKCVPKVCISPAENQLLNNVLENCKHSAIINELQDVHIQRDCCKTQLKNMQANPTEVATKTETNRGLWNRERQYRITGSRCYSIYTYAVDNWTLNAKKYFWPKSFSNKYVQHGIKYESVARELYKEKMGCLVLETGLIVCEKQPWLAFSPDGIVMHNGHPVKLLEIKCPYSGKECRAEEFVSNCTYMVIEDEGLQLKKKTYVLWSSSARNGHTEPARM